MAEIFFTSDTHFGHKNILQFEAEHRPFDSLEEMHDALVDNWNRVVSKQDVIFHLGDVCFGDQSFRVLTRLNGNKKLVLGNHDQHSVATYSRYFSKIYGVKYWEQCILSHVPVHLNSLGYRAKLNVHGHLHSHTIPDERYFNVGVDLNNLTPVHADIIREKIVKLES